MDGKMAIVRQHSLRYALHCTVKKHKITDDLTVEKLVYACLLTTV